MTIVKRLVMLAVALSCASNEVRAQLGEMHIGALGSYGLADAYGAGGGLVLGVAAGRLTYVGVRWVYYGGSTQRSRTPGQSDVTSRVQAFAVDLGVLLPVGQFEIVPGISLGGSRFTQRNGAPETGHDGEFLAAPGLSIQARLGGFLLIPEVQYFLTGDPEVPRPVQHRGPVFSLRFVRAVEVSRIRH